ncbi:MAG: sugar ABC transporter ATP-binding protein, partial [Actinomycetota bacterium]|nr:sugar ABC transporter ATP-binding protein [Actinomycetota bacterium]
NELKILLLDDPCAGIDINSKIDIFKSISDFSESGKGVILVSSELSELLENCDRILILKDGKIKTEIGHADIKKMNEEDLLKLL